MPKVKIPRKSTNVDMTAMCDVAFLLLTFFMLTAKFKPEEALAVDTPSSSSELQLPEKNVMLITVDTTGRVFWGVDNAKVKMKSLEKMAGIYGIGFTEEQKLKFANLESIGVPIDKLPGLLDLSTEERAKPGLQTGIPVDTAGNAKNQLADWILQGRLADAELNELGEIISPDGIMIAIKGDGKAKYPSMDKVIKTLVDRKVNRFNLVTDLEGGGTDKKAEPIKK